MKDPSERGDAGAVKESSAAGAGGALSVSWRSRLRETAASDFVQKVAGTFATRILLVGLSGVTAVLVARTLGPAGRGLFAVATAITAIGVQMGNLGLHAANTFYVARDRSLLHKLVGTSLVASLSGGALAAIAVLVLLIVRPSVIPIGGPLLAIAVAGIPVGIAYLLLQNLALAVGRVGFYNGIDLFIRIETLALLVILAVRHDHAVSLFVAAVVGAPLLGTLALLRSLAPPPSRMGILSWSGVRPLLAYGIRAYLAALFAFLVLRVDVLLVDKIAGAPAAGYYSVAATLADMLALLSLTAGALLFPRLAAIRDMAAKWKATRQTLFSVAALTAAGAVLTLLLRRPIVIGLFGAAFAPTVPALVALLPGIVCWGMTSVLSSFVASIRIPNAVVGIYGVLLIGNIVLNLLWIPRFGIVGAGFASSVCYFGSTVALWRVAVHLLRTERRDVQAAPRG